MCAAGNHSANAFVQGDLDAQEQNRMKNLNSNLLILQNTAMLHNQRMAFPTHDCLIFQDGMRNILCNLQLLVGDYYCECLAIGIESRLTTSYGLALFPGLPHFSSSVCTQSNTRKRRAAKNVTEKA